MPFAAADRDRDADEGQAATEDAEPLIISRPHQYHRHRPATVLPAEDRVSAALLLLFSILGLGTLLPWNFFTTARGYFDFKLRNVTLSGGGGDHLVKPSWMSVSFESYLAVFSNVPGALCVIANTAAAGRFSVTSRMVVSLLLMTAMFVLTSAFVMVNTDYYQTQFFWATLVSVALMNGSGAVMQGSLYGLVSMFPGRYIKAVTLGQSSGGVIAAAAYIISLGIGSHPRFAAFVYFLLAIVVLLACLAAYLVLRRLAFVQATVAKAAMSTAQFAEQPSDANTYDGVSVHRDSSIAVARSQSTFLCPSWRHIAAPGVAAFLILGITLTIYPTLLSSLAPMSSRPGTALDKFFSPLSCFLAFNAFDLIGRLSTTLVQWPRSGTGLVLLALLRLGFLPLFLMCNYRADAPTTVSPEVHGGSGGIRDGGLPLLFSFDAAPPILVSLFGLTNGYLFTLSFIRGSETAPPGLAEVHGAVMGLCSVFGSCAGSALSFLFTPWGGADL